MSTWLEQVDAILEPFEEYLLRGSYADWIETDIKPQVEDAIFENFVFSQDPDGRGWLPRVLAPDDDGHPLLVDTTLLVMATQDSVGTANAVHDRQLDAGVDLTQVPYARAHNFGVPERNLPAREYLGVSQARTDDIVATSADRMLQQLPG